MKHHEETYRVLSGRMPGRVFLREPMARHTSMGVGGPVDCLVCPQSETEVQELVFLFIAEEIPFLPLGNGTNLIVREGGYRGVFLFLGGLEKLTLREEEDRVAVTAETGVSLSRLVQFSAARSLTGLEFLAGIPGTVGGAIRMNAGAWGGEIKDMLRSLRLVNGRAAIRDLGREELVFRYRSLDLPEKAVVLEGTFVLSRGDGRKIRDRVNEILEERKKRHPVDQRSAGSIFKNPPEGPAGKWIDEAGLKGFQVGGAKVSVKHGNFIVNEGGAGPEEIIVLMRLVRERVLKTTGIFLEPEVKIVGETGWEAL